MKSMTGYGQAAGGNDRLRVAVSIRSVNHRYLDVTVRLADEYRELEAEIRQRLERELHRGRIDARVSIELLADEVATVSVDEELVRGVVAASDELSLDGLSEAPLEWGDLLRLPDVIRVRRRPVELREEDRASILDVTGKALETMLDMRRTEGAQLESVLEERLATLRHLIELLGGERDAVRRKLLDNMRRRVAELLDGVDLPAERLAQETALLAEKIDVQEELDRLAAHLSSFGECLGDDGAIGRKLDFLAQEIHRELNTLGAKCRDARMGEWAIDGKLVCEQLREQVQNVE